MPRGVRAPRLQRTPVPVGRSPDPPALHLRTWNFPERRGHMRLVHESFGACDDVRMGGSYIMFFAEIGAQIIECNRAVPHRVPDRLPVPEAHGLAGSVLVEFPIKKRMVRLLATEQRGQKADAVELRGPRGAGDFRDRGYEIANIAYMIARRGRLDVTRPARDERHADAAFG